MRRTSLPRRLRSFGHRLARAQSGLALIEFALAMPIVLTLGMYGIETSNLALANLRVSQVALNLADNASRVGLLNSLSTEQLREVDMNDVLQAARLQGQPFNLTTNGRITVSSVEADASGNQIIHWQRCIGLKSGTGYDSTYGISATNHQWNGGTYDPNAGVDTDTGGGDNSASHPGSALPADGMGDTGAKVKAPNNSGVIFVEINYLYQPLLGNWLLGPSRIHYIASFIVRDRRDFTEIYNPAPTVTASTCNLHSTGPGNTNP